MSETQTEPTPESEPAPDAPPEEEGDGEPEGRIVKAYPEMPTQAQVDAAQTTVPAVDEPKITVGDGDPLELRPDDAARLATTIAASDHPAFTEEGNWGDPELARGKILGEEEEAPAEEVPAEAEAPA